MRYRGRNKSHHKYVVVRDGKFLGYYHNVWHAEYPDAFDFDSLPDALQQASQYSEAVVIRDYGFESEFVIPL